MNVRRVVLAGVAACSGLVVACGDDDSDGGGGDTGDVFTENDTQISVDAGDRFTIELPSNPTTGYSWEIGESYDEAVVTFLGEHYESGDSDQVGAGGTEQLRFVAGSAGSTTVVLEYVRPWEEGVAPAQEATFDVTVS
jgi:inhibitor of cysteine peptidase